MALISPAPKEAEEALSKARVKLMIKKDCSFFATLILQAPVKWITGDELPTAATDGINLFMNPDFLLSLDPEERVFLVLHEVMHNVYNHGTRVGFRDHKTWNEACDYVINDELIQRGFKMPQGGLHNIDYRDMDADAVYSDLVDRKDKGEQNTPTPWPDLQQPPVGDGTGQQDPNHKGIGGTAPPTAQQVEDFNKDLLTQAVQAAQMNGDAAGSVPGSLERQLENMLRPKLPWDRILSRFLFSLTKNDYSYRRPNRRLLSQGIYLPSLYSEGVGKLDFAIDTSGSVSEDDFNQFISEIGYVFKRFNPDEIGIMQFDSILQSNDKVCSIKEFQKIKFQGGGGTNVEPILAEFKTNTAKALLVLTDGYFHHSKDLDPKKPVFWLIYDNPRFQPEFGTVVHFNKD